MRNLVRVALVLLFFVFAVSACTPPAVPLPLCDGPRFCDSNGCREFKDHNPKRGSPALEETYCRDQFQNEK
jgi:hypothetical protein